ncbi:MAG: hypothetical protein KR126chlam3_00207 [Chlamydiae bacterium]|nr:hypothetical protein [Chlamydiota bacterium]
MSALSGTSSGEREPLSGGEAGTSSRDGSGLGHNWSLKDKAVAFSVATMLLDIGSGLCDILERSFWCHGAACKDFESQHIKREACNWVAVGLSGLAILSTIVATALFIKSLKHKH